MLDFYPKKEIPSKPWNVDKLPIMELHKIYVNVEVYKTIKERKKNNENNFGFMKVFPW